MHNNHTTIYLVGIVLLNNVLSALALNIIFFPAMGWLIGLAIHGTIVFIVWKPIRSVFTMSILIHVTTYIFTSIFLVTFNLIYFPEIMWSFIAMGGWAFGLGLHIMLKVIMKK